MDRWHAMRVFVKVGETGSFAASRLAPVHAGRARPTVEEDRKYLRNWFVGTWASDPASKWGRIQYITQGYACDMLRRDYRCWWAGGTGLGQGGVLLLPTSSRLSPPM